MRKDKTIIKPPKPIRSTQIKRKKGRVIQTHIPKKELPPAMSSNVKNVKISGDEVYIVGGGPSLSNFDFNQFANKCTIAVNRSIFNVPNPNYFITVDFTFLSKIQRRHFNTIPTTKFFVADLSHSFMKDIDGYIVDTRCNLIYDIRGFNYLIKAYSQEGIGYTFETFKTGLNSGFCALQLAIILGFTKIHLFGLDLSKQNITHYHGGYGEDAKSFNIKLDKYFKYFKIGLEKLKKERPDIQVISYSKNSRLNDIIPYKNIEDLIC